MSEKIVQLNEEVIKGQLKELVRGSVEETLNELLEAEAQRTAGGRGGETDPGSPVRAQRTAPGLSQRPLQPQPHHHLRGCHPQGA